MVSNEAQVLLLWEELGRGTLGKTSRETGGVTTNPIQQRWAQSAWLSNHW